MTYPAGLNLADTIAIESPGHLGDVLREASDRNQPVIPVGGGTCLATGRPVDHGFLALDMSPLSGIDSYVPTDMTASFQAGTPISEVRAALAANGQELPIDLADDDAGTIGGLVATGFSGPRRFGQGTLKDLIIGCEYVRGDGMVAKAGGMTVKNVSGFEISRLLHGSWGSLAVLTRINMKVLPIARMDQTFVWNDPDFASALDRQQRLLEAFPGGIALASVGSKDGFFTGIRFAGREPAIEDYRKQLNDKFGEPDEVHEDARFWQSLNGSESTPMLVANNPVTGTSSLGLDLSGLAGVDEMYISLPLGTLQATIRTDQLSLPDISKLATGLWMIEGGEGAWKTDGSVWGPERPDRTVAESIKHQFDPAGILNRGRLFI